MIFTPLNIVILIVLLIATVTDLRTRKIYNWLTIPALVLGLVGQVLVHKLLPGLMIDLKILGLCTGIVLVFSAGGLGGGDVKLIAAVCALAGWPEAVNICFWSALCGGVLALLSLLFNRQQAKIVWHFFQRLFWSLFLRGGLPPLEEKNAEKRKFPYSLAILAGFIFNLFIKLV